MEKFCIQYNNGQYEFDLDTVEDVWLSVVSTKLILRCKKNGAKNFFNSLPLDVHSAYKVSISGGDVVILQNKEIPTS
jgi:hypothetical protein